MDGFAAPKPLVAAAPIYAVDAKERPTGTDRIRVSVTATPALADVTSTTGVDTTSTTSSGRRVTWSEVRWPRAMVTGTL
jgi:hypothetical protein